MMAALKDTLTELLGSKKFLMLVATVLAAGAAKLGWNVDASTLLPFEGLAASAILAQGIADHGKSAAEAMASTSPPKVMPEVKP